MNTSAQPAAGARLPRRRRRARRGRRHHRDLPALPGAPGGLLGACSSRRVRASAARGTGTATRGPASTPRATPTATSSREELFDEWEWREHFAAQPETERYLNHVVDRFDLRRLHALRRRRHRGRLRRRLRAAGPSRPSDGTEVSARYLIAATGVLSVPYTPDVPGRDGLPGRVVPHRPVAGDAGRLHGQAGGGDRDVVQRRAGRPCHRRRRRVADRVPADGQLVHAPEQRRHHGRASRRELRAGFEAAARGPQHVGARLPPPSPRPVGLRRPRRRAPALLRADVEQPGVHQAHEQLPRPVVQSRRQRRVVRLHRRQDPEHRVTIPGRRSG